MKGSADDSPSATQSTSAAVRDLAVLRHDIEHAAHLLPAQGPIGVFIHHNTLHAFEEDEFSVAVLKGQQIFGCEPYPLESEFARQLGRGRILDSDLVAAVTEDLADRGEERVLFESRREFRTALLRYPVYYAPSAELRWYLAESRALQRYRGDAPPHLRERFIFMTRHWAVRDLFRQAAEAPTKPRRPAAGDVVRDLIDRAQKTDPETWNDSAWESFGLTALWRICRRGLHGLRTGTGAVPPRRHRDLLLRATGEDADRPVHELLIRFTSAYLDQGLAAWQLPGRDQGYFSAFVALYRNQIGSLAAWRRGLRAELRRIALANLSPLESIAESLDLLGVSSQEQAEYLDETLLALRGFGGMLWQIESRGDRVPHPVPVDSLVEFLAVRLILDRLALRSLIDQHLTPGLPLDQLRRSLRGRLQSGEVDHEQLSFQVFHAAQVLGWLPHDLLSLSRGDWQRVANEFIDFSGTERRRVFHAAYERRHRIATLDALAAHRSREAGFERPRFQVVCCLDEREESFRRHLEEVAPDVTTFGVAGFFGVAMYYQGAADAHYTPLCPVVIKPSHWVREDVLAENSDGHRLRRGARRLIGDATHRVHLGSRTLSIGALLAGCVGLIAWVPLVMRVLFPRRTAVLKQTASQWLQPSETRMRLERAADPPSASDTGVGFSLAEMTRMASLLLHDIGLTRDFARLVLIIGHGSSSLNNPHESAYNCGACGGSRGGPNARAMAHILNDRRVREALREQNLNISDDTVFVGLMHNTCDDSITEFDARLVPATHAQEFARIRSELEEACCRNAHERCRRFESASLSLSFAAAKRHVEARAQDLAEVRPEYGHGTNAVCFVGRRDRTRGLFMDRRCFLASYDATQDPDAAILNRILGAAVPVCAGISLEYYFSRVDPTGWGCGTKLPHNITSLIGVMDGAASDLRTGLTWQMIELHEPVRLLFVIETTPEAMSAVFERNPTIARLCRNRWLQLALLDPHSDRLKWFDSRQFVDYRPESAALAVARSSTDWYRGWRDHLDYAAIMPDADVDEDAAYRAVRLAQDRQTSVALTETLGSGAAATVRRRGSHEAGS